LPTSIYEINSMAKQEREALLSVLLPRRLLEMFSVDPATLLNDEGIRCVRFICPEQMPFFQVNLRRDPNDRDAAYFLDVSTSPYGQMEISFVVVNDPNGERFDIDVDKHGQDTYFGTARRNVPEEIRAMQAGLSPGQVRRGLKAMKDLVACWEEFFGRLGHTFFFLEPLTYNSAILYERSGFQYLQGSEKMKEIDREFRPGGALFARLDGSTPFRMPGRHGSVRGRSWAIHDGVLDGPWESPKMYKTIGVHAGASTFTGEEY
jgi:hypothetical protein